MAKPELDLTDVGENEETSAPEEVVETTAEEVAADPVVETPPTEEEVFAPEPTMAETLTGLGFEGVTDDDASGRLLEAYQKQGSDFQEMQSRQSHLEQMARYGQQHLAQQAQQPPAAAPQGTPEAEEHWWTPPAFDPEQANRYRQVSVDAEGNQSTTWKDDTPAEVRAGAEAYQAHADKWASDLTYRPDEVLPPIIQQIVDKRFEELYSQRTSEALSDAFYERIEREQGHRLYQLDPVSQQPLLDQYTQEPVFSDYGRQMQAGMAKLRESGVTNPETQWNLANDMVTAQVSRATETAAAVGESSAATAARRRQEHIQRATGQPQRGGSVPPADQEDPPRQNRVSTPGQQLLVDLAEAGVIST